MNKSGPSNHDFSHSHLYPENQVRSSFNLGTLAAEIPEDVLRARHNTIGVPPHRLNLYNSLKQIQYVPQFKLITDPLDYEMEYKKRNLWSLKDMKTFIVALLKGPKRFEKIGEALPHKTAKEIVFFYHTFKKLLRLKQEIKNSREALKLKIISQHDFVYAKQAEVILEPLTSRLKHQKIDITNGNP